MNASELHARSLNAKEMLPPQRSRNFIFPVADGTVKIFGGGQRLRTSTLARDWPERGEEQEILQGIQMYGILHPIFKKTQPVMMWKRKMISGRSQENSFIANKWNPESNCTCRKKNHFLFQLNTLTLPERHTHPWMYCWRKLLKITGTWMEKKLSDAWTGFTRFIILNERPPDGYSWSGRRLTRKQATSRPDNVWPDM